MEQGNTENSIPMHYNIVRHKPGKIETRERGTMIKHSTLLRQSKCTEHPMKKYRNYR